MTQDDQNLLAGVAVGITAERRADQQVRYLESRGATVVSAPVLKTLDAPDPTALIEQARQMIADPPAVLVVQTGQAILWWFNSLDEDTATLLVSALANTEVWCRGPKATSACRRLGLSEHWQAPHETTSDIIEKLEASSLSGVLVAALGDGNIEGAAATAARLLGAIVTEIKVYRYDFPDDLSAVHALIGQVIAGSLDAVTFTSSPAIDYLRAIAQRHGTLADLDAAFSGSCIPVVVGPVCAETARLAKWTDIVEPRVARLMPMMGALADKCAGK